MNIRQILISALLIGTVAVPAIAAKPIVNGKIAFVSDRDGNQEIYVMNPDGSAQTRLTDNPGPDADPAWSPDGKQIAFVRGHSIFLMNGNGSGVTQLTFGTVDHFPAWSPDGRTIAFQCNADGGSHFDICTVRADGTNRNILTDGRTDNRNPAWSPDGRSIAFGRRGDTSKIALMNADGTGVQFLTDPTLGYDDEPFFSPDGKKLVFAHVILAGGKPRVTIMNADGSDAEKLADGTGSAVTIFPFTRPVFSPDGKRIAFASLTDSEKSHIRLIDPDGSNEIAITHNEKFNDSTPSWQRAILDETTGVYLPSTGVWLLRNSNTSGDADIVVKFGGQAGDLPVAGDWDGDGKTDLGIFRKGTFIRARLAPFAFCILCQNFTVAADIDTIDFGQDGDIPVAGDWDGDGDDDIGVWRPGVNGTFFLRVPPPFCELCSPALTTVTVSVSGTAGDLPVAGDWNLDGKDDVATYNPPSNTFFLSDEGKIVRIIPFGRAAGRPLAGDWLGQGIDGLGIFEPSLISMMLATELGGAPDIVFEFGVSEGLPVAGHWR